MFERVSQIIAIWKLWTDKEKYANRRSKLMFDMIDRRASSGFEEGNHFYFFSAPSLA